MKAIADTGFLVALARRADKHHAWAAELSEQITEPLLTCDAVLAEVAFHLESTRWALAMVESELVISTFSSQAHTQRLLELAEQFDDLRPDFADLCVVRMSELHPKYKVITVDRRDFTVLRRNGREPIPLIMP